MGNNGKKNIYRAIKDNSMSTSHLVGGLDKHITCGYYLVELNHVDSDALGLPVDFCGDEHYLKAHLLVTESGTNNQLQKNRRVGQVLFFTGCNGCATDVYSRCGDISSTGCVWGGWARVVNATDLQELRSKMPKEIVWGASSKIYSFTDEGVYTISGERLNENDGLPIANAAPGHTVNGRLIVLDSSITGSGNGDDKCVTQILALSNRTGGDGDIYVRTGSASSKNILSGGGGWENWGKLQLNIAVGQVTSLNSYIQNGVYSGVYTDGSNFFETFVMVVINNYAVAGATDNVRSISQFKYALDVTGLFTCKTRVGQGNTGIAWGEWVDMGVVSPVDASSTTTFNLGGYARESLNSPLRALFIAAGAEYNDTGTDEVKTEEWGEVVHKNGCYYLNGVGDLSEDDMLYYYTRRNYVESLHRPRLCSNGKMRTLFPLQVDCLGLYFEELPVCGVASFAGSLLEIFRVSGSNAYTLAQTDTDSLLPVRRMEEMFLNCPNLRIAYPLDVRGVMSAVDCFKGCVALQEVRLFGISFSCSFADSPLLSKASLLYMISNAAPTVAITITLHPDAYARLAGDADVVAALEPQPLVSLVGA